MGGNGEIGRLKQQVEHPVEAGEERAGEKPSKKFKAGAAEPGRT